jgi:tRNA (guanine-N7-)-methyltransferase
MFPDPWPKVRHHKRRLLQVSLLETLTRLLVPGGVLHIASDHEDYVREILESTAKVGGLTLKGDESTWSKPFFDGAFPTRYETKARLEGRASSYFPFKKG